MNTGLLALVRRSAGGAAGARAAARLARDLRVGLDAPVVHRDRYERRPARGERRVVDRAADRVGDILSARRLVAVLDVRLRADDRVTVGQVRLDRDLRAHLLAGGDDERRLVRLGVEDPADGVADARCGVEVDVCRAARRLRVAVGHADDDQLLEAEDVGEVLREVAQHRQLSRARVAEDRRHPVGPEQVERRLTHSRHQPASPPWCRF
jgi:hypothetical protein